MGRAGTPGVGRGRRTAVTIGALVLLAAACSDPAPRADGPVANHGARPAAAPEVLGATETRTPPIVMTPFERESFLEIALRSAATTPEQTPTLTRWTRGPRVVVSGAPTAEDVRQLVLASQQWTLAIGLPITVGTAPGDIEMAFIPRAEFASTIGADPVDPDAVGLTRVRHARDRRGELVGATVVIATDDHQLGRNRTIAHELGHAVGLQHSTCASSLMDGSGSTHRSVRWRLTPFDLRMGALLYAPALTPGLDRAAVDARLAPTASIGVTCTPVDLELIRAEASGRQYLCEKSPAAVRPCTADLRDEPRLPIRDPDAWTDGASLTNRRTR